MCCAFRNGTWLLVIVSLLQINCCIFIYGTFQRLLFMDEAKIFSIDFSFYLCVNASDYCFWCILGLAYDIYVCGFRMTYYLNWWLSLDHMRIYLERRFRSTIIFVKTLPITLRHKNNYCIKFRFMSCFYHGF